MTYNVFDGKLNLAQMIKLDLITQTRTYGISKAFFIG